MAGIELFGRSMVCERCGLLPVVSTEPRGMCGGDSEGDVPTFAVPHGFGGTIEEGDWSRVGVTELREEGGEGEDDGEAIQASGKYAAYCEDVIAAPDEDITDEARSSVCRGGCTGVEGREGSASSSLWATQSDGK